MRVSGARAIATSPTSRAPTSARNGTVRGWPIHCAMAPAISPPRPSPPRFAAVLMICARLTADLGPAPGVEFRQPHRRRRRRRTDTEAAQHAGDEQAGQCGPRHEHQSGDHVQRDGRNQQPAATVGVGEVTGEDEADGDGDRIDGERDRDGQRREAVAVGEQRPQRRRHGGERHQRRERERNAPEAKSITSGISQFGHGMPFSDGDSFGHLVTTPIARRSAWCAAAQR